jgi:phosphopantetheinyl transferase (holo-ACP synthase)
MATRSKRANTSVTALAAELPIGTALSTHAERAATCELELIQLFLTNAKHEIARRRLQRLVEEFAGTFAAKESQRILKTLSASDQPNHSVFVT